jgi:large subunit ribosomal protein L7/L12
MSTEAEIKELGDKIAVLTLKEAISLSNYLEEEHGIEAASGGVMVAPGGGGAEEVAAVEQTSFDVYLNEFETGAKIKVIKAVRAETGVGLKEAKTFTENLPAAIKEGISKEDAEALAETFKELGAVVEIK